MRVFLILSLVIGCYGMLWKPINDFKELFKQYSSSAIITISSIESILETSTKESELFLNNTYSNNPTVARVTKLRSSEDKCFASFIDEDKFKFSFNIQIYQLQIPLRNRIVDIRERLNNVNSSVNIYGGIADSKYTKCESEASCLSEIGLWLESNINSLSCLIYPNCSQHSIRKRSICSVDQFSCGNGHCIPRNYFCDTGCDCTGIYPCPDEPPGCVKNCNEFRCSETFRCISKNKKCNGVDDCGDGSDEEDCPPPPPPIYMHVNCSIHAGDFLCDNNNCIGLEQVCDGHDDCGDLSDEGDHCDQECSPECEKKGGFCFTEPKKSRCLYECPPGSYETSRGCSRHPEAPLPTLIQVLEDTPRLIRRYTDRLKYLKLKTNMALSKSLREVVKCKKEEFTLLSKVIDFSTVIHEEKGLSNINPAVNTEANAGTTFPTTLSEVESTYVSSLRTSTEESTTAFPQYLDWYR